jgi:hypothetical protein
MKRNWSNLLPLLPAILLLAALYLLLACEDTNSRSSTGIMTMLKEKTVWDAKTPVPQGWRLATPEEIRVFVRCHNDGKLKDLLSLSEVSVVEAEFEVSARWMFHGLEKHKVLPGTTVWRTYGYGDGEELSSWWDMCGAPAKDTLIIKVKK